MTAHNSTPFRCVSCPDYPLCPICQSDEYCVMTSLTCGQCPITYCAKRSSNSELSFPSSSNSTSPYFKNNKLPVGGIVGGVIGGVIFFSGLLFLIYSYYKFWSKNKKQQKIELQDEASEKIDLSLLRHDTSNFSNSENRSSVMTAQTRASNILPIAYIPGVTAVGRKFRNNSLLRNGDTRSHITLGSSILGDDDNVVFGMNKEDNYEEKTKLTATIRNKPKLVQINEEYEDERSQCSTSSKKTTIPLDPFVSGDSGESMVYDSSDDDGSFILDVEITDSLKKSNSRDNIPPESGSRSPFGDDI